MPNQFKTTRIVQFADTNMAGILHFASYYRIMEEVEHAFWRSVGQSVMTEHDGAEIGWPRVKTGCEYFAPAHFEDELDLVLTVADVTNKSVSYEIEFRRGEQRLAVGRTTAVCCTFENGKMKAVSIPEFLRTPLEEMAQSRKP